VHAGAFPGARLRVLYLLAVAVGVFLLPEAWQVAAVCLLQVALWFLVGLPPRRLLRQILKLWVFATLIVLSYALVSLDPETDRWVGLFGTGLEINVTGAAAGGVMVLRILTVVLASLVARQGDPQAIAHGLRGLGMPRIVSVSIDTVLALFGDTGRGRGGGGGGGRRRPADAHDAPSEGFWTSVKRLARGDVRPILDRLDRQIRRARAHAEGQVEGEAPTWIADVGVIAGISLTMLGIRALKVLPAIPFAPGHKGVILLPLYVLAARLTRSRMGGTLAGLTMGTVAFLMGEGRYGVFEIAKHVAPGLLCDLTLPLLLALRPRPGPVFWSLFGAFLAVGRFATIFLVTLLVQAPAVAFAFLVPGVTVHGTFGILSGYVTYHLMRGVAGAEPGAGPDPS
jgi:hypothetical protein